MYHVFNVPVTVKGIALSLSMHIIILWWIKIKVVYNNIAIGKHLLLV